MFYILFLMSHVKYQLKILIIPFQMELDPKAAPSCIGNQFTLIHNTFSYNILEGKLQKKIFILLLKIMIIKVTCNCLKSHFGHLDQTKE